MKINLVRIDDRLIHGQVATVWSKEALRMAEAGVQIKSVNIGGMSFKTGKTQITKAVSVDESDIAAFKKLHEMGIELEIRPVATDKKVDLMSKIEGIEG